MASSNDIFIETHRGSRELAQRTETWRWDHPPTGKLVLWGNSVWWPGRGGVICGWHISLGAWGGGWALAHFCLPISAKTVNACSAEVWGPPTAHGFLVQDKDQNLQSPVGVCWMTPTLHCQKSRTYSQETVREVVYGAELARGQVLQAWARCSHGTIWGLALWTCRGFQCPCPTALDHGSNNQESPPQPSA